MTTLAALIGRMQPPHKGHAKLLQAMLADNDHVIVLLGSSLRSRDTKNPFRWQLRAHMAIELLCEISGDACAVWDNNNGQVLAPFGEKTLCFVPIKDFPYADNRWQYQVQKMVETRAEHLNATRTILYGNYKDASSWYLKLFPRWERQEIPFFKTNSRVLSATDVRDCVLAGQNPYDFSDLIGESGALLLSNWLESEEGIRLQEEAEYIVNYKKPFEALPYPPIFHTADSVITWRGLVLLGRRRAEPGKGLWALPGGFVNADEWVRKSAQRELMEEARTKVYTHGEGGRRRRLKFNPNWLRQEKRYDWPSRSQRGRIITTAFHWQIPDHFDVMHEAADDLVRTQFHPIRNVLDNMDYDIFEDHQMIIADMVLRY